MKKYLPFLLLTFFVIACNTKPDYKKIIPNMGMVKNNSTGNLIIDFSVEFPDSLSAEQIEQISAIL